MKTIKNNDTIKRVNEKDAVKFVAAGWSYVPKSEWKKIRPKAKKTSNKADKDTNKK